MHHSSGEIDICEPDNSAYAHLQDDSEVMVTMLILSYAYTITQNVESLYYGYPCMIGGTIIILLAVCMS